MCNMKTQRFHDSFSLFHVFDETLILVFCKSCPFLQALSHRQAHPLILLHYMYLEGHFQSFKRFFPLEVSLVCALHFLHLNRRSHHNRVRLLHELRHCTHQNNIVSIILVLMNQNYTPFGLLKNCFKLEETATKKTAVS